MIWQDARTFSGKFIGQALVGGYDDAVTAFTYVAARKFASPSCQQVRALSSRFSGSGCPEAEGTRLSGEQVITRADSFHSASTSTSRRTRPLISPAGYRSKKSGARSQNGSGVGVEKPANLLRRGQQFTGIAVAEI